jgi:N6-adenosine-specific RNA methylase IME4
MSNVHALVRYEAACRALAEAKTVDEAKDIRDKAEAMRVYARQANNKDLEIDAAEIRISAERRLGELIKAQKETVGLNKGVAEKAPPGRGRKNPVVIHDRVLDERPTLKEAGISKDLSSRAQKLAALPEAEFKASLGHWRDAVTQEKARVMTDLLRVRNKREREKTKAKPSLIPAGRYGTIVIDPPWPMEKIQREVRPNQAGFDYPTLSEAEISGFDVAGLAADDCHLFCWTTQRFLPMALRCIEAWGFRYVLTMVWHKPGGFQPVGLPQFNCEFAVYARSGSPKFVETKGFNCCFTAPRREHSRKPDEFYDVIRRVTDGPRVDVFSREKRDGFDQAGNELEKFEGAA